MLRVFAEGRSFKIAAPVSLHQGSELISAKSTSPTLFGSFRRPRIHVMLRRAQMRPVCRSRFHRCSLEVGYSTLGALQPTIQSALV
jgi:hypothetical protein